jgi:periplasmic divalent cation tolerance protein
MGFIVVMTTTASEEEAGAMARSLVEDGLAACVHIQPIRSIYRWKGELYDEPEWRLAIKTTSDRYDAVERHIREGHSYETAEVVRLSIGGGSQQYLRWIEEMVSG